MFDPTWESIATHAVPPWFEDAKLGVFLHWGLYSVPGWAPRGPDVQELLRTRGPKAVLRESPYAEWYLNSMQLAGSPTWRHHRATYGEGFAYDDFVPAFDAASAGADLDALADLCRRAGAGYVVLTAKHHDGFCLWPSALVHPVKGRYQASRDLVGGLTDAVRRAGLRMGLYYSGGYDWPYNGALLASPADAVLAVPRGPGYCRYAAGHVRELVDRYRPSVLWNDIGWPSGGNLPELIAHYYNSVEDGLVNDRWLESTLPRGRVADALVRGVGELVQLMWPAIPESRRRLSFPPPRHYDVRTPEYSSTERPPAGKWELTRGVGHSFGANREERPQDLLSTTELVRLFVDVVSKNGNLLIGVGPRPDGTVPDEQQQPLRGLGRWMEVNGEGVTGSRPWALAEASASDSTPLRFTQRDGGVYAFLLAAPGTRSLVVPGLDAAGTVEARLLGSDEPLPATVEDGRLTVRLPERLPVSPAHCLRLTGGIRPARA